jgi:methionyl aminopeptidase
VIIRKSPEEIERIAASGDVVVRTLRLLERMVRPGVTTAELDDAAEKFIRSQGGVPTFKGYRGFPASICASPNSMIVHGIPGSYALERGDVISLDVGVTLDGWVADAARTFAVGSPGVLVQTLLEGTRDALFAGVEQVVAGNRLGDVSHAIQEVAEGRGLAIVRTLVGHGVGRDMHEDPQIPNYGEPGTGPELAEGMVLAIEPMTTAGGPVVRAGNDGWAIYSQDGSLTAHFEFTVAVTALGPRVLTPWHRRDGEGDGVGNITRCARVS